MQKSDAVFSLLKSLNKNPKSELNFSSPYECFVAVLLSAQCLDKTVNKVTPGFFAKFKNFKELANAEIEDVAEKIRQINFYKNKAKYLVLSAKKIMQNFGGKLPETLDKLVTLNGVSRKTAQVVMLECFNIAAIPVDTHVFRVVNKVFGQNFKKPIETENFIKQNFKTEQLNDLHKLLVLHGRYVCKAQSPACGQCVLKGECNVCRQG